MQPAHQVDGDELYEAFPLSRSNPIDAEIYDGAKGVVVRQGQKTVLDPGTHFFDTLLPSGFHRGMLYIVPIRLRTLKLPPMTVQSLDRWDVDLDLYLCVEVISPEKLIDEPNPSDKLLSIVTTAARYTFGCYTANLLDNTDGQHVDIQTVGQRINDICSKELETERGVAGLKFHRVDFDVPWQLRQPSAP